MKKLRLDLDTLSVQSFETDRATPARGTVKGHLPRTVPGECAPSRDWYCSYGYECTAYPEYCLADTAERCQNTYTCPINHTSTCPAQTPVC
jgi:hypothetical protein